MTGEKGFIGSLFDFSFTNFVTQKIIKILYFLAILLSVFSALAMIGNGFKMMKYAASSGMLQIVLAPIICLLAIVWSRIFLELVIVLFTIADNTTKIVKMKQLDSQKTS